jgi:hypothetical protein
MSMQEFINMLTDEQKKAFIKMMSESMEETAPETKNEPVKKTENQPFITDSKPKVSGQKRREPVRAKENQWEDTGEHRNVITPEVSITPRNRKPPSQTSANCHVCGKSFKVDKRFVYGEFYRCDRCVGR